MYFTREPIVETIITPKEGYKLVVRNSKGAGQEEYFADAVEVVRFDTAVFFRSVEKPKPFLLPVADYEVLEVRETRMVLRHVAAGEKPIKIAGGRVSEPTPAKVEAPERKKERRRQRRPRQREEGAEQPAPQPEPEVEAEEGKAEKAPPKPKVRAEKPIEPADFSALSSLLPPPSFLIAEKIDQYRDLIKTEAPVKAEKETVAIEEEAEEASPQEEPRKTGFSPSQLLRRFRGTDENESGEQEEPSEEEPL